MPSVKCPICHGKGRVEHPISRAGGTVKCDRCKGTGDVPLGRPAHSGISWTDEQKFPDIRMGLGAAGQVPVPTKRPVHMVCGVAEGLSVGHTYTFEIPQGDLILTYSGVPIEAHDLDNELHLARLDKAILISARRE